MLKHYIIANLLLGLGTTCWSLDYCRRQVNPQYDTTNLEGPDARKYCDCVRDAKRGTILLVNPDERGLVNDTIVLCDAKNL